MKRDPCRTSPLAAGPLALGRAGRGAAGRVAPRRRSWSITSIRAGVGFNDPTPASPGGRQHRHHAGPAAADRVQVRRRHLGQGARRPGPDRHRRDVRAARLQRRPDHARPRARADAGRQHPAGNVIPGLPPNVLYPQPLADQLAGVDLDPGVADIVATFNGGLNDCDPNIDWYYGLDAKAGVAQRSRRGRRARARARPGLLERRRPRTPASSTSASPTPSRRTSTTTRWGWRGST